MTKKQIIPEFPNEVDILRSTLAEVKVKLPGLDAFLLANPECTKCSNSKAYRCVEMKGKPGCRTCSGRRISCTRHVQYLVETTASRLEWSVEKTKSMYDKFVKQTRTGKRSVFNVKKVPTRKDAPPQTVGSGSSTTAVVADKTERAPEEESTIVYLPKTKEKELERLDGLIKMMAILPDVRDDSSDDSEYDDDRGIENTANNIPHSISNATLRTASSIPHPLLPLPLPYKPRPFPPLPSDPQEKTPTFSIPVLEPEEAASSDLGLHDPTSLRTEESERTDTVPQVDDLTQQLQSEDERNETDAAVPEAQSEHTPESSMSPEQRIKQLEEKVEELNALRLDDAASISRLEERADTAFDNMSVLLSHVRTYRQELETIVTKHIETAAHQKPFKSLIDKMDETSVSGAQILMLLDKRKDCYYVMPKKTRVPVVITDEEGQEWVPWDVISDDNDCQDTETEAKRRRDSEANGEGSSKRRKC